MCDRSILARWFTVVCIASLCCIGIAPNTCSISWGADWNTFQLHPRSSLRGIYPIDSNNVWVCGSEGVVIRYSRRDEQIILGRIAGLEHAEVRSIHAWDDKNAIIATSGQPACIYKTADGGVTWSEVYRSSNATSFFNGLKFLGADKGVVFGDPINNRMELLITRNAGATWQRIADAESPSLLQGEAGFAASNSSLMLSEDFVWIGLGGTEGGNASVLSIPTNKLFESGTAADWKRTEVRSISRSPSRGVFSLARSANKLVAVGGDYKQLFEREGTLAVSDSLGTVWRHAKGIGVRGFRSAVVYHTGIARWIATGPTGTDISQDGETWIPLSELGFHTLGIAKDGSVWGAGADGAAGQIDAPTLLRAMPK
ncbi:WD40/YVTN/BNR-like repeat-containing protein [Pirellulaceae bacterium SH501]